MASQFTATPSPLPTEPPNARTTILGDDALIGEFRTWKRSYASDNEAVVAFFPDGLRDADSASILETVRKRRPDYIAVVSSARATFGDELAARTESNLLEHLSDLGSRCVLFRATPIVGPNAPTSRWLDRWAFLEPLIRPSLTGCCVEANILFAAIETERHNSSPRSRVVPLLGPNLPWKQRLREHATDSVVGSFLWCACYLLSWLLLGYVVAFVVNRLVGVGILSREWNVGILRPATMSELLQLVNKYNTPFVKVVGYNNGATHFGHRYPGKTVVSTVLCNRVRRIDDDIIQADCGATIRQTLDFLAPHGQELHVIPNYSYVCVGTAFFVPIHGSASDYTTLAETITKAILYIPSEDRILITSREDDEFRRYIYDVTSDAVLLRLSLTVKPKSRYFLYKRELANPSRYDILTALHDVTATNVEIRKSNATSDNVDLYLYYNESELTSEEALEIPRDKLGRLWDKLEENAITSWLFHTLTRTLAWHVELFFTEDEFHKFWDTHKTLPIRKLQLRYIRKDGFPNSPFRDHDCISADMFMLRKHRQEFEMYLDENFQEVRSNPGKHSR